MIVSYKYKLYRSKKNKELHSLINHAGWVWNHALALQKRYYRRYEKYIDVNKMQKHFAKLRRKNLAWMLLNSQSVQEILQRQDKAYKKFFKKKQTRPPKFKKQKYFKSFLFKQTGYKLEGNKIIINSIKKTFKFSFSRAYGSPRNIRIYRDRLGDIYLYIVSDMPLECVFKRRNNSKNTNKAVGLDFGLKQYLTYSDKASPKQSPLFFKQSSKAIKKANRSFSRKQKNSNNRERARKHLCRVHKKVVNKRRDWQWKLAHELCKQYDFIAIEDLNIKAMQRMWGRKISDLSHSSFVNILKHVAMKYGTIIHEIDRWYPSSKECHCCRNIKKELSLKDRTYICESCGYIEDRDTNAAKNIFRQGVAEYESISNTELAPLYAFAS